MKKHPLLAFRLVLVQKCSKNDVKQSIAKFAHETQRKKRKNAGKQNNYNIDEKIDACCLTNCLLMPEYNLQKYNDEKNKVLFH